MILPVVAYGDAVLKKVGKPIDENNEKLQTLIENMWETMYNANGIGIAAPQVGKSIRLFVIDTVQLEDKENADFEEGIKKVYINPEITEYGTETEKYEEGCLSIPDVNADVARPLQITISYLDEHFKPHTDTVSGFNARVIQHEYDHIEGILFTDKIPPLKKRMLKGKLAKITKGKVNTKYKMRFPV